MVHQYQLNGYNIVLDTCSGSVHVVDDVAYDIIAMYPEHTADEIVSAGFTTTRKNCKGWMQISSKRMPSQRLDVCMTKRKRKSAPRTCVRSKR